MALDPLDDFEKWPPLTVRDVIRAILTPRALFWGVVAAILALTYVYFFGPWVNDMLLELSR